MTTGTQTCNIHTANFGLERNDPSVRFNNIISGYESMNRLTDDIANSFNQQSTQATEQQAIIDIVIRGCSVTSKCSISQSTKILSDCNECIE